MQSIFYILPIKISWVCLTLLMRRVFFFNINILKNIILIFF
jgi:hypothetical protein